MGAEAEYVDDFVPEEIEVVAHNALCDRCENAITGIRYKCLHCNDYDLCSACEEIQGTENFHDETHVFAKLHRPMNNLFATVSLHCNVGQKNRKQKTKERIDTL